MAGQDKDNYAEALKIFYARAVSETLNRRTVLYDMLTKTKTGWSGKQFEQPVHMSDAWGTGARTHNGTLPVAGNDSYVTSTIQAKYNYVRMSVFNTLEAHSATQAGAWAAARADQIRRRAKSLADSLNRQCFGNETGGMAECLSAVTWESGVADNPAADNTSIVTIKGFSDSPAAGVPETTKHLKVGQQIAWGATSTTTAALGRGKVSQVLSTTTFQITVGDDTLASATPVPGNIFFLSDETVLGTSLGQRSANNEITGLGSIISDTGSLQGINPATETSWKSQIFTNPAGAGTTRAIEEDLMQQVVDAVEEETAGEVDMIVCHHSARRSYANMLKDKNGEQFFISKEDLKVYEVKPFAWDESSGGVWKWSADQDAVTGFGKVYFNLGTSNRKALASLRDIEVTGIRR